MSVIIVGKETKALIKVYHETYEDFYKDEQFLHIVIPEAIRGFHCDCYKVLDDFTITLKDDEWDKINGEKWDVIRAERNKLLLESDWRMCRDVDCDEHWVTYRAILRDLPTMYSNPEDVVFPLKPSK